MLEAVIHTANTTTTTTNMVQEGQNESAITSEDPGSEFEVQLQTRNDCAANHALVGPEAEPEVLHDSTVTPDKNDADQDNTVLGVLITTKEKEAETSRLVEAEESGTGTDVAIRFRERNTNKLYYQCNMCPAMQSNATLFLRHKLGHGANLKFACKYCNYSSDFAKGARNHETMHERMKNNPSQQNSKFKQIPDHIPNRSAPVLKKKRKTGLYNHRKLFKLKRKKPAITAYEVPSLVNSSGQKLTQLPPKCLVRQGGYVRCDKCAFKASNVNLLHKHYLGHGADLSYKCCYCDYSCSTGAGIGKHELIQHKVATLSHRGSSLTTNKNGLTVTVGLKSTETAEGSPNSEPSPKKRVIDPGAMTKQNGSVGATVPPERPSPNQNPKTTVVPTQCFRRGRSGALHFYCDRCPLVDGNPERGQIHYEKHGANLKLACDKCDYSCNTPLGLRKHTLVHNKLPATVSAHRTSSTVIQPPSMVVRYAPYSSERTSTKDAAETLRQLMAKTGSAKRIMSASLTGRDLSSTAINDNLDPLDHLIDSVLQSTGTADGTSRTKIAQNATSVVQPIQNSERSGSVSQPGSSSSKIGGVPFPFVACKVCGFLVHPEKMLSHVLNRHPLQFRQRSAAELLSLKLQKSAPELPMYACKRCPFKTGTKMKFQLHVRAHGSSFSKACPHCDFRTKSSVTLERHIAVHEASDTKAVTQSSASCSTPKMESEASTSNHGTGINNAAASSSCTGARVEYSCPQCSYTSPFYSLLKKHIAMHSIQQKPAAPVNVVNSATVSTVSPNNDVIKTGIPTLKRRKPDLDSILKRLKSAKTNSLAPVQFPPRKLAMGGFGSGGGSRFYSKLKKCPHCPYKSVNNMTRHVKMHQDRRMYPCSFCSFSTDIFNALNFHIRLHELNNDTTAVQPQPVYNEDAGLQLYVCGKCPFQTYHASAFKNHNKCHSEPAIEASSSPHSLSSFSPSQEVEFKPANEPIKAELKQLSPRSPEAAPETKPEQPSVVARPSVIKQNIFVSQSSSASGASGAVAVGNGFSNHSRFERKQHPCPKCPYTAHRRGDLMKHIPNHGRKANHKCRFCDFCVESHHALEVHENLHRRSMKTEPGPDPENEGPEKVGARRLVTQLVLNTNLDSIIAASASAPEPSPEDLTETESYFADLRALLVEGNTATVKMEPAANIVQSEVSVAQSQGFSCDNKNVETLLKKKEELSSRTVGSIVSPKKVPKANAQCVNAFAKPDTVEPVNNTRRMLVVNDSYHEKIMGQMSHQHSKLQQELGYKCIDCEFRSKLPNELNQHLWTHGIPSEFTAAEIDKIRTKRRGGSKCNLCPYTCGSAVEIERHMERHRRHQALTCPYCSYSSEKINFIRMHLVLHDDYISSCTILSAADQRSPVKPQQQQRNVARNFVRRSTVAAVVAKPENRCIVDEELPPPLLLPVAPAVNSCRNKRHWFRCKLCPFRCRQKRFANRHAKLHRSKLPADEKGFYCCLYCKFIAPSTALKAAHRILHMTKLQRKRRPLLCRKCGLALRSRGQVAVHRSTSFQHCIKMQQRSEVCQINDCGFSSLLPRLMQLHKVACQQKQHGSVNEEKRKSLRKRRPPQRTPSPAPSMRQQKRDFLSPSIVKRERRFPSSADCLRHSMSSSILDSLLAKNDSSLTPTFTRSSSEQKLSHQQQNQFMYEMPVLKRQIVKCEQCPYTTKHAYDLATHSRMHDGSRRFRCAHCSYSTERQGALRHHQLLHLGTTSKTIMDDNNSSETSFSSCGSGSKKLFVSGLRTEMETKPTGKTVLDKEGKKTIGYLVSKGSFRIYNCSECPYHTSLYTNLLSHSKMHRGSRPFQCSVCSFSSEIQRRLLDHTSVHEPGYNSKQQEFFNDPGRIGDTANSNVDGPMIRIQSPYSKSGTVYRCQSCPFTVQSYTCLWYHLQKHKKPGKFKCDKCSFQTDGRHLLTEHSGWHSKKEPTVSASEDTLPTIDVDRKQDRRITRGYAGNSSKSSNTAAASSDQNASMPKCSKCSYQAKSYRALFWHKQQHHHEKESLSKYHCQLCPFKGTSHGSWWHHRRMHQKKNGKFQCKKCPFGTDMEHVFSAHVELHDLQSEPDSASEDNKQTERRENAINSASVTLPSALNDSPASVNQCHLCPFMAPSAAYLRLHLKMHEGQRACHCKLCSFNCSHTRTLRSHMEWHNKASIPTNGVVPSEAQTPPTTTASTNRSSRRDRPNGSLSNENQGSDTTPQEMPELIDPPQRRLLKCSYCPYRTKAAAKLKDHEHGHEVRYKFACERCSYSTEDEEVLKKHETLHSNSSELSNLLSARQVFKYFCPKCSFQCEFANNFTKHINMHGRREGYMCCICDYSCARFSVVKYHEQNHHGHVPFSLLSLRGREPKHREIQAPPNMVTTPTQQRPVPLIKFHR